MLQVARGASQDAIRAAYRRLAASLHPDTNPVPDATARMAQLNAAWHLLGDAARRSAFDATHPPHCPGCGLCIGLFSGCCRVCQVQDAPSVRSTSGNERRFNQALWTLRAMAPLEHCAHHLAEALGAHAPELVQRESEFSDRKIEAMVPLAATGEMASLAARLWIDGPGLTTLRVSIAADLPWGEATGEPARSAFDRLVLGLASDLEHALRHAGIAFEAAN